MDQRRGPRQVRREPHHGNRGDRHESPLDNLVLKHLKEIKPALAKVQAAWKAVEDNSAKDTDAQKLARLEAMQSPLNDFDTALYAAYRDHLHEKDAWETGVAVGKEFRKQGAKK